jgi:hypothetical protein
VALDPSARRDTDISGTNYGLGQHFATLSPSQIEHYLFVRHLQVQTISKPLTCIGQHFYVANGTYNVSTTLIKLSLLFQYLRVFEAGAVRKLCIGMIVLISCWGFAYSFMGWFPCFPIRAYWDWSLTDATCYAYGAFIRRVAQLKCMLICRQAPRNAHLSLQRMRATRRSIWSSIYLFCSCRCV